MSDYNIPDQRELIISSTMTPTGGVPTLETIPVEVLQLIVGFLDVSGLKSIRTCSRRLAHNTRSLLCRNVSVTETVESFTRMISLCEQNNEVSRGIRSLSYIPLTIRQISEGTSLCSREHWARESQRDQLMPFDEYLDLLEERSTMAKSMSNVAYLAQALRAINPHNISIILPGDGHNNGYPKGFPTRYKALPSHAHFLNLHNRIPRHMRPWYAAYRNASSRGVATRSFMAILLALAQSKCCIQSLEAMTGLIFLLSPNIDEFCQGIKGLKKLHLTIDHEYSETDVARLDMTHDWDKATHEIWEMDTDIRDLSEVAHDMDDLQKSTFGKFLSHAESLEDLTIRIRPQTSGFRFADDIVQLPLLGYGFPHLKTLVLTNIKCHGDGLLLLFSRSKKLIHVQLEDIAVVDLDDDWLLWPRFFSSLRTQIKENRITIRSIKFYGWFDRHKWASEEWDRDYRAWYSHMGYREDRSNGQEDDKSSQNLGQRMEDFVLGKTTWCIWSPARRNYIEDGFNDKAELDVFLDDNFAKLEESEIEDQSRSYSW